MLYCEINIMALPRQNSINLINKTFSYIFRVQPLSLKGYYNLLQGFATWVSDGSGGGGGTFDCHLKDGSIVRSWDGFLFYARPRTSDLYAICCEEIYELENWFKLHAMGAVVDVGAYIGTYTVRATHTADLVIAIEPLPINYKALQIGIKMNDRRLRADIITINKAVAETKGKTYIYLPIESKCIDTEIAKIEGIPK